VPLRKGEPADKAIKELHTGDTVARTKRKFGKKRAQKQAIAIALENERKGKRKPPRKVRRHPARKG
jgi:hypothetical protein